MLTMLSWRLPAQDAQALIARVRARLDQVNDYVASGRMKTNVAFIKSPEASVKVYYKKPDKIRIRNEQGISFIPRGSVNISLGNLFSQPAAYDIIDVGRDASTGWHVVKLLPRDDQAEVVLSTLYIEEERALVRRASTTTRDNGSYDLGMDYGKYAALGLPDKVVFTFNTSNYKLPKGITLDYDDGSQKKQPAGPETKKGRVEIVYTQYQINQGVDDKVFTQ